MTALNAYLRLESTGLWRASPSAQRRDVYIFLGDASLVITDKAEQPLAHWSLPAVGRLNPGATPAVFMPGPDASETLEIDDPEMILAIEKVQHALDAAAPKPGRLRLWIGLGVTAAIAAGAIFWLPGALMTHAERVVPLSKRIQIGRDLLGYIVQNTGAPCGPVAGSPELRVIATRLDGQPPAQLYVVPNLSRDSLALPGGIIVLDSRLIEDYDTPSVAAGYAIAQRVAHDETSALLRMLDQTRLRTSLSLLTTGTVSDDTLRAYAQHILQSPATATMPPNPDELIRAFVAARVASTPYAQALDPSGETTLALIEGDPFAFGKEPELLPDNSWVALQTLCE